MHLVVLVKHGALKFPGPVCLPSPRVRNRPLQVTPPPARKGGVFVESVDELVEKLKNEAGVL